ncbi:hypothetical protein HJB67_09325 [Rhizobium lentis]|uniref:hypothetical protein n=1 Tax=Rhizobium lentis TaxID=1138194 RepID=UPI001C82AD6A|nr:hypothetical protein [Rhizobium lentis]MBX5010171.1 hypothetical protein [Rhizobium lentis]
MKEVLESDLAQGRAAGEEIENRSQNAALPKKSPSPLLRVFSACPIDNSPPMALDIEIQ